MVAVPKPKHRKQKKAVNNNRPTSDDICTYEGCKRDNAELHEVFFGPYRQLSIKHKMQKRLCYEHHRGASGPHHNREYDLQLKREYQQKFEAQYSRELFIKVFGRNYLEG